MLNVGFTRARDEMHVFLSAPIEAFGMASGGGTIREWLEHCSTTQVNQQVRPATELKVESEFEAEVMRALLAQELRVVPQYPSCRFRIDIVAQRANSRVAVECDGEVWHLDENGHLRTEDVQRQEILERAGWRVVRIPYRQWRKDPEEQVARVLRALDELDDEEEIPESSQEADPDAERLQMAMYEAAIVTALKEGIHDREKVLRRAREVAGHGRLGPIIRLSLDQAEATLARKGLVVIEDGEMFATDRARAADIEVLYPMISTPTRPRTRNTRARRRRSAYRGGYYRRRR